MDPKLFVPFFDNKYFPKCVRKFFRFGVPEYKPDCVHSSEEKFDLLHDGSPAERNSSQSDTTSSSEDRYSEEKCV